MSTGLPAPGYVIYRDVRAGEPVDPTTPPLFFPPKDSDELFDALRAKYPHVKTHSERMRDAIIEFLIEERHAEQAQTSPTLPSAPATSSASPWTQSWPSVSASTLSSPEIECIQTPMVGQSPRMGTSSSAAALSPIANNTISSAASPPVLEQMTSVFSISSTEQPRQRIRRKMTEAEKADYRQRRLVKACDKCAKRKRKCNHNQPATIEASANPHRTKVTKTSTPTMKKPLHVLHQTPNKTEIFDTLPLDNDFVDPCLTDMECFGSLTTILDDTDFNAVDFLSTDDALYDQGWAWPPIGDMPLFDTVAHPGMQQSYGVEDMFSNISSQVLSSSSGDQRTSTYGHEHHMDTSGAFMADTHLASTSYEMVPSIRSQTNENIHSTGSANILDTVVNPIQEHELPPDKYRTNHVQIGEPQPQHTTHAHAFLVDGAFTDEELMKVSLVPESRPCTSKLRTDGTVRAIRAFGGLLRTNPHLRSRLQSVTVDAVASLAQSLHIPEGLSGLPDIPAIPFARLDPREGRLDSTSPHVKLFESCALISTRAELLCRNNNDRLMQQQPTQSVDNSGKGFVTAGTPEIMQISDYLRMHVRARTSRGFSVRERETGLTTQPMLRSDRGMLYDNSSAALNWRSAASLGGTTLDNVVVPTTDYFLLRRGLQSIPGGATSHQTSVPTPLLQNKPPVICSNEPLQVRVAMYCINQAGAGSDSKYLRHFSRLQYLLHANIDLSSTTVLAKQSVGKQNGLNISTLRPLLAFLGCLLLAYILVTTSHVVQFSFVLLALLSPAMKSSSAIRPRRAGSTSILNSLVL